MIQITTKDGSEYTIDPCLIACIAKKKWKNLDGKDAIQTRDICSIYWMGGGEVHIAGANYEQLVSIWRAQRTEVLDTGELLDPDKIMGFGDQTFETMAQDLQANRPDKK